MTLTSHGHHIPGTSREDEDPEAKVARCGGIVLCHHCKTYVGLKSQTETPLVFEVAMRILIADLERAERAGMEIFTYEDIQDRLKAILDDSIPPEKSVCATCMGARRETTGLVCQDCGKDYGRVA